MAKWSIVSPGVLECSASDSERLPMWSSENNRIAKRIWKSIKDYLERSKKVKSAKFGSIL